MCGTACPWNPFASGAGGKVSAMGQLDDAIREHLELKRLRGADPGEVIRQEHEALGPVLHGDEPASDIEQVQEWDVADADDLEAGAAALDQPTVAHELNPLDELAGDDEPEDQLVSSDRPREPAAPVRVAAVEQETVEVDMDEMLDQELAEPDELESGVYDEETEDDEDIWWEDEDDSPPAPV